MAEFKAPVALTETLLMAVPMWQQQLRALTPAEVTARGVDVSQIIAEHGDDLMYGGPHTRAAFNALAEGLALGSMVPGGVTFAGWHFHDGEGAHKRDDATAPWHECRQCRSELRGVVTAQGKDR